MATEQQTEQSAAPAHDAERIQLHQHLLPLATANATAAIAFNAARDKTSPHVTPAEIVWALCYPRWDGSADVRTATTTWQKLAGSKLLPTSTVSERLADFCASVACEQRADWRRERATALDLDAIRRTTGVVTQRLERYIVPYLRKRFGPAIDSELVAGKATDSIRKTYWSETSQHRLRLRSKLSTLAIKIAFREAIKQPKSTVELADYDLKAEPSLSEREVASRHARTAIEQCKMRLAPAESLVFNLIFEWEVPQKSIALVLDCRESWIAELKRRALQKMRECLSEKGYES